MASSSLPLLFLCSVLLILSSAKTTSRPKPKALVLQVTKDAKTLQYVTQVSQRTPLVPVKLTLDLGGEYMWVNCDRGYTSSTFRLARCDSTPCKLLNNTACGTCNAPRSPDCYNNTCGHFPANTVTNTGTMGDLRADVFAIQSTNGMNVLGVVTVPRLYFICGSNLIQAGLANGVTGMAGLGRTGASLPAQLSSYFKFDRVFALCLSSSTKSSGVLFFGNGPYTLLPNIDASSLLTYIPLIINPVTDNGFVGDASPRYFIGMKSININNKRVNINETLLTIDDKGYGGTTISTVDPYTVLESSIYNAVVAAFVKEMPKNVERVSSVSPFGACFDSKNIGSTRLGAAVPSIDLVMQNKNVWTIYGANSMVEGKKNVLCLALVEAPTDIRTRYPVIIGAHQLEDNLLKFDLSQSSLGFSSSLLGRSTTCANFNFTSSV